MKIHFVYRMGRLACGGGWSAKIGGGARTCSLDEFKKFSQNGQACKHCERVLAKYINREVVE